MKKIFIVLTVFALLCNAALFAASTVANSNLLTVLHPEQWGLDGAIKGLVTIGLSYIVGLFTKSPSIKRRKKD